MAPPVVMGAWTSFVHIFVDHKRTQVRTKGGYHLSGQPLEIHFRTVLPALQTQTHAEAGRGTFHIQTRIL